MNKNYHQTCMQGLSKFVNFVRDLKPAFLSKRRV